MTGNVTVNGHMQYGASAPGVAAAAGAGTSPPAPVIATGSNDCGGTISWGTGTSPNTQSQLTITFSSAWVIPGGGGPHVVLTPGNSATAALGAMFVTGISPTAFQVNVPTAPAASQGNTTYQFSYMVAG